MSSFTLFSFGAIYVLIVSSLLLLRKGNSRPEECGVVRASKKRTFEIK
jgi:hypothetical protein